MSELCESPNAMVTVCPICPTRKRRSIAEVYFSSMNIVYPEKKGQATLLSSSQLCDHMWLDPITFPGHLWAIKEGSSCCSSWPKIEHEWCLEEDRLCVIPWGKWSFSNSPGCRVLSFPGYTLLQWKHAWAQDIVDPAASYYNLKDAEQWGGAGHHRPGSRLLLSNIGHYIIRH